MAGRRVVLGTFLAAAAWTLLWAFVHPPVPHHGGSDLYEQLTVARHLAAGEGFLTDIAYPLSAAFPFATRIPQPLIHRPPGYPLLLVPAVAGGADPATALQRVRLLHLLLLGSVAGLGMLSLLRTGRALAVPLWLGALLVNPLLDMGARWGQVEIVAGLLLLGLWLRRDRAGWREGVIDGILAAAVALFRLELAWLPWLLVAGRRGRRWWAAALLAWALLLTPWLVRNARLAGDPLFSLQAHAEQRKGLAGQVVSPYLELEPERFDATLRRDPGAVAAKTLAGVRHQVQRLGRWLPWPLLAAGLAIGLRRGPRRLPRRRLLALAACILLYAPLSHDPRHLLPLLPLLLLGLCATAPPLLDGMVRTRTGRLAGTATLLLLTVGLLPARMPGWDAARHSAAADAPRLAALTDAARALPPGPILADDAAVFWWSQRMGMIRPARAEDLPRLRAAVADLEEAYEVGPPLTPPRPRPDLRADRGAEPGGPAPAAPRP